MDLLRRRSEKHFTLGKEAICWNRLAPFILSLITIQEGGEEVGGGGAEKYDNRDMKKKKGKREVIEDGATLSFAALF